MLLLVNVGAGALLLPPRIAGFFAALAALGVLGQCVYGRLIEHQDRNLLEAGLYGLSYFATATLCIVLGKQMRETEALAEQRGIDLANLAQINELIIRRMKTGVLVVDDANRVHRWNESAWALMGNPKPGVRDLGSVAPELSRRLYHWRTTGKLDNTAVALAEGAPEVIPRFTRLTSSDDNNVLIFLDDTSLVSRRAEELTLSSLGRLSASIAHEIRNPLAAISYSAQLLAESEELSDADKRMVEIINNHCSRVNEIVENILQLSRRERSRPESLDLSLWAVHFVEEYKTGNDIGQDQLRAVTQARHVEALADPQQMQQVVWNLVQNALRYGRLPDEPARVSVVPRLATEKGAAADRSDRPRPRHSGQSRRTDIRAVLHHPRIRHWPWPVSGAHHVRGQPGHARIRTRRRRRQLLPHHPACAAGHGSGAMRPSFQAPRFAIMSQSLRIRLSS